MDKIQEANIEKLIEGAKFAIFQTFQYKIAPRIESE